MIKEAEAHAKEDQEKKRKQIEIKKTRPII